MMRQLVMAISWNHSVNMEAMKGRIHKQHRVQRCANSVET